MVPARARPAAGAAGLPAGDRGQGLLRQERAEALPRLDRDGDGAQARGRRAAPGAGQRRGDARLPRRPERDHAPHVDQRGPTGSSSPTGWSSTSTRRPSASPRSAPRHARSATCCATSGFEPFAMTTGSRGLHVVVALRRTRRLRRGARVRARGGAPRWSRRSPSKLTTEFRIAKRGERIFVDVHRNAYGAARRRAVRRARPARGAGRHAAALGGAERSQARARRAGR